MNKIKHILYKEWVKTKYPIIISGVICLFIVCRIFTSVLSDLDKMGSVYYYSSILNGKTIFFYAFKYLPFIVALLIGLFQYIPEVVEKRIKLSIHLPVNPLTIIYSMIIYGFVVFSIIIFLSLLLLTGLLSIKMPWEVLSPMILTIIPWILGGMTTYFLVAMLAFEPTWKYRIIFAISFYFLIKIYFSTYPIGNAVTIFPVLIIATLLSALGVLYTSHRFIKGLN
ncbi:MAG: hypothetical protein LIO65_05285 [Odoribacter sp.]|nr:hypothetical protein [Odoribacter sp.]